MVSKFKKGIALGSVVAVATLPSVVFAQEGIFKILDVFKDIIEALIPIIIGLAVLVFIWGIFRYVISKDDEAKERGRDLMIWGIIGLFVMVSVWGLVNLLGDTLDLRDTKPNIDLLP